MRYRSTVAAAAVLVASALISAGCGESTEDAERALCADLATLRSSVATLSDTNADTTVKEFEQSRENVREAWADVKASADNLGSDRFDAVEDAWDDVANTMDNVDSKDTLGDAREELVSNLTTYAKAEKKLGSGIDCSTDNA